jgi:hypothetical protein
VSLAVVQIVYDTDVLPLRVKEHLGTLIQTGNEMVGHSSVEDSAATLDLVRWYVLNKSKGRA